MTTVFIISAPSGSGKSTLVKRLLSRDPRLLFSVSYTTRPPRNGEVDGESYNFVSRAEFERMVAAGDFLEHAPVFRKHLYGTHKRYLEEARATGRDLVLDIDVQGERQLKEKIPEAVSVFILAPSREILESRLRARGDIPDEEELGRRLREAAQEISRYHVYDYILINRDLAESDATLCSIVRAERVRRLRMEEEIRPILETFQV
jgi:guanylate kinase